MVVFRKTLTPCLVDDVISWHLVHGWVWDVLWDNQAVAVFYITHLNGDGVVLHFSTLDTQIPPAVLLSAFRKGLRICEDMGVIFATIPADRAKLLKVVQLLGFKKISSYDRAGSRIMLLQYFQNTNATLSATTNQGGIQCQEVPSPQR